MYKRCTHLLLRSRIPLLILLFILPLCQPASQTVSEIRIRLPQDPETLNPVNYSNVYGLQIIHLLFQTLLRTEDTDGVLRPLLASSLPVVSHQDSLTYLTYQIRKEARWDDGKPVTAGDIIFSIKVLKAPLVNNEKLRMRYEAVQNVIADSADTQKVTFVCNRFSHNLDRLTGDLFILPAHIFDPQGWLKKYTVSQLISQYDRVSRQADIQNFAEWFNSAKFSRDEKIVSGSGGYILKEWRTGQYVVLQKKHNWWVENLSDKPAYITANLAQINFQIIPDNITALQALKGGKIDLYSHVPANEFLKLTNDIDMGKNFNFFTPETYDFTYVGINSRLEKFAGKHTRQAIAHLMDIDNMIRITQHSFAVRTVGPLKPGDVNYNAELTLYPYDVNKARALLQADGWQNENGQWVKLVEEEKIPLTINLQYKAGNSDYENIAHIFKQAAAEAGIPVEIQPMEGSTLSANLRSHQFEVFIRSMSGGPAEYDFKPILHTESAVTDGYNYTAFGTTESDSLIEAINETTDPAMKSRNLKRFQHALYYEANLIFLFVLKNRIAAHKRLGNIKITTSKPGYDVSAITQAAL